MSESAKNMEIEDVLSSIRRLVTEEGRDANGRKRPKAEAAAATTRLVLTPALRVEPEAEAPFQLSAEYAAAEDSDEIRFRSETRVIDHEAPWSDPTLTLHEAAALADHSGEAEPVAEAEAGPDPVVPSDDDLLLLQGAEPEAEAEVEPEPVPEPEVEADPEAQAAVQPAPLDMRNATLSAKIQALEAAIAQTEDQWEPDGSGSDTDYAAMPLKTIPWQDELPATAPQDVAAPPEEAPEPEGEAFLDEEMLRQLVADIVREELQGALGERITRNVRKLVRREIQRALTSQALD